MRSTPRNRYTSIVNLLRDRVASSIERARGRGALVSLPTDTTIVEDRGIPFVVHISALLERKDGTRATKEIDKPVNPFLPPDPDLVVCGVPPDHLCVLNKFNVLDQHLLIVTRAFEPQQALLNLGDFAALLSCMDETYGLGFYNGGTIAGASQAHKHLQLVPLPLAGGPQPTPVDAVIDPSTEPGVLSTIPAMEFSHALLRLDGRRLDMQRAKELHQLYRRACAAVGVDDETRPYNLLITRRWMLLVPRSRENWRGVSINALGFAGSLLVRNRSELDVLKRIGPLAVLRSVATEGPNP